MKVYLESMGCDSNIADTNRIRKYLDKNGVEMVSDYNLAEVIILMSCGFNNIILKDNIDRLKEFRKTNAKVILGGCIPKIKKEILEFADYSFGPNELCKLDSIFNLPAKIDKISPEFDRTDKKIIRIATGCAGKCSYCVIKTANGFVKSRSADEIIKDIESGIKDGFSRFVFTSEDVGSWGQDIKSNIVELLQKIETIGKEFKITLTMVNPRWFIELPELFGIFKSEKIEKKIYLSFQSGSDRILKLMNRKYSVAEYVEIFDKLKKNIPNIKIQTDVLVGFPTESEEDFLKTFYLLKELEIYFLQVFLYTDMEGTESIHLTPKVPYAVAEKRVKKLISYFLEKNKNGRKRLLVNTNVKDIKDVLNSDGFE